MIWSLKLLPAFACLGGFAIAAASGLAVPQARAQCCIVAITDDTTDYAFLYADPTSTHPTLVVSNADVKGNLGIARNGGFIGFGPGTVTGQVRFAAPATATSCLNPGDLEVTGGTTFGNENVQVDFDAAAITSENLSKLSGTPLVITGDPGHNWVKASSGKKHDRNLVFTATIGQVATETGPVSTFTAGTSFTIYGTPDQYAVINIADTKGLGFNGSFLLDGIPPDHVMINFHNGNFETLTGGDTLTIDTDENFTTGMFVNINGPFNITNTRAFARFIGGGSVFNSIIQTKDTKTPGFRTTIEAPPLFPTPESSTRRRKAG
jgi:hypothetical protein